MILANESTVFRKRQSVLKSAVGVCWFWSGSVGVLISVSRHVVRYLDVLPHIRNRVSLPVTTDLTSMFVRTEVGEQLTAVL